MREIYHMTSTFQKIVQGLETEEEAMIVGDVLEDYCQQIVTGSQTDEPVQISRTLHAAVELFVTQDVRISKEASDIRCASGCAHCCYQIVAMTLDEAHELVRAASQADIAIDRDKLVRQCGHDDNTWQGLPIEDRRCVFLGPDQRCTIYDARPMSCRKYFVASAPDLCNIERYPKHETRVWYSFHAEALTTAAFTVREAGFMPEMLLEAIRLERSSHEAMAHEREV